MIDFKTLSDQELSVLLKERDQVAFTEVYRRYWHPLYLHAYKMLSDEDQAKDVIQELFIAVWAKTSTIHINTSLKSYLYVMARNMVISHIRKNRTNDDLVIMFTEATPAAEERLIKQIDDRNLIALIDDEINQLPPRMKQVFEMSRKDFLSNKEIAIILGTTEETVKKQISNSIKTIKTKLEKYAGASIIIMEILRQRH